MSGNRAEVSRTNFPRVQRDQQVFRGGKHLLQIFFDIFIIILILLRQQRWRCYLFKFYARRVWIWIMCLWRQIWILTLEWAWYALARLRFHFSTFRVIFELTRLVLRAWKVYVSQTARPASPWNLTSKNSWFLPLGTVRKLIWLACALRLLVIIQNTRFFRQLIWNEKHTFVPWLALNSLADNLNDRVS